ncbi:hypothetical protein AVEN_69543-1 [Araneus ventricosus]|uniref:Uncharacterized protein n=1 Tax=Araneus ventricosus TaxID=182803 RepID=A0A4Y2WI83_ARAVE|nr:hypothetical protein AVEN_69543-1 [Araneus ventricosus]
MLATSLSRQECKLETTLKQVNANELVTTLQTCHKLAASHSLQTIAKTEYEDNLRFERTPDIPLPKPVVLTTQPARLCEVKIDCANRWCI